MMDCMVMVRATGGPKGQNSFLANIGVSVITQHNLWSEYLHAARKSAIVIVRDVNERECIHYQQLCNTAAACLRR